MMASMELGESDGFGRYGILEEDAAGLLCHECGERFGHLGCMCGAGMELRRGGIGRRMGCC